MKNKILRVFLAMVIALPMFTSVFAISSSELLARLDTIVEDIDSMKQEYNKILEDYPDVINSLSAETKAAVENLADNLMADNITSTVNTLKAELSASTAVDSDKVLDAIETLETEAKQLIEDNKDIVEEVKTGYSDLTVEEIKQVVDKVVDIVESLGANTDVTDTYNQMMTILDDAHDMALQMNVNIKTIIANNVSTFESALSKQLIKDIFEGIKAKDLEGIIDTLIDALDNAEGGAQAKADLKETLEIAKDIKDKLMELDTLSQQDLIMFSDVQKEAVSNKVKDVEKDYIDFAKVLLDNYSTQYMDVVVDLVYTQSVDDMIRYGNTALDYYAQYEDTIKSLSVSTIVSKLPDSLQDLVEKAGLMVALGFVDISEYNLSYIKTTFSDQIDDLKTYISQEMVEYMEHIDKTINKEVENSYNKETTPDEIQSSLRGITAARFNTMTNIKALKERVDTELLANRESLREKLAQAVEFVTYSYERNIMMSVSYTIMKENDKEVKEYEGNASNGYIITNKFISTSDFTKELGIPEANESVVEYLDIANSKLKTGSQILIDLEYTAGELSTVVLGDIYADGLIDARDYMVIKNYIMDNENVEEASLLAADTYRDKLVDSRDYMVIKNYIMDGTEISL